MDLGMKKIKEKIFKSGKRDTWYGDSNFIQKTFEYNMHETLDFSGIV